MNLSDYTLTARRKLLVYGQPKTGKTAIVGKLASKFKLHWIDLEQGVKTLLNPAILAPEFRKNVNIINVPDHKLYPIAVDTVREILRGGLKKICYTHGKVNCPLCNKVPDAKWSEVDLTKFTDDDILVIDSLTQLGNSAMNKSTLKEISKPGGEDYKPTFTDYMTQGALLEQMLSLIQVLDLNIAVISHIVDVEKSDTKEALRPMAGTRNFSANVAKYFDSVVYMSILNKKHHAYSSTTAFGNVLTGDRFGVVLDTQKDDELSLLPIFTKST